jgi:hypothetical protein
LVSRGRAERSLSAARGGLAGHRSPIKSVSDQQIKGYTSCGDIAAYYPTGNLG